MKKFFKDVSVKCALFMMAYYVTNSVFQSFMSLYYTDRGLDNTQIGTINALSARVSVFVRHCWGEMGDRAKSRNRLLALMAVAAAAFMGAYLISDMFWALLVTACLFAAFYTSLQPMGDSIILASLAENGRRFGPVRMAGGLSFAVVAMLFGNVLDALGDRRYVVYTVSALCLVIALAALNLPKTGFIRQKDDARGMLMLFKNRELLILFLFMVPLQITLGYFYAFFSPLFRTLPGASDGLLGWCYFISAVSETPFLINSDRLFEKYGAGKLMCVSAITLALRWLLVSVAKSAYVAMFSQLLHSWGFIVITVTVSKYVQATVPANRRASGQLLISVFGFGVARVIGYFGGGFLADRFSRQAVFLACSILCFACFVIFAPYYLRRPALNGQIK